MAFPRAVGSRGGSYARLARLRHGLAPTCLGCDRELSKGRWPWSAAGPSPCPSEALSARCLLAQSEGGNREPAELLATSHREWQGAAAYWMEDPWLRSSIGSSTAGPAPGRAAGQPRGPTHFHPVRPRSAGGAAPRCSTPGTRLRSPSSWPGLWPRGGDCRTCLGGRRRRSTRAQARLPESQRLANVADAFSVAQPKWVQGRVWVVVDDVVTTASTTNSVLSALRMAGARGAVPVALALA
jgi:hypothetical protein